MTSPTMSSFYVLPFGNPSSGTFTLSFTGSLATTTVLQYNCSASAMQSALLALVSGVTVTGGSGSPWMVTAPAGYVLTVNDTGMPVNASIAVIPTGSLTWSGNIMMSNNTDYQTTGIATGVFTPSGGVANLPALVDGQPGQPPNLSFSAQPLQAGASPTVNAIQTAPGGAGEPSAYNVSLGIPVGAPGAPGPTATVGTASDVEGSPTDGAALIYSGTDSKWKIQPIWVPTPYSCQSFTAGSSSGTSPLVVASIGIPAQAFAWRPRIDAQVQVTGTANTHLDLGVFLGSPTGSQVGYGFGVTGVTTQTLQAMTAYGAAISGTSTFGMVNAGATATLYLVALQTASTTDAWSVATTHASFEVEAVPIP